MLYLIHGTDSIKAREKLHTLLDSLISKKPDVSLTFVDVENSDSKEISDLIYGQGLFESKRLVVLDHVLKDDAINEVVFDNLKDIADSPNIFVFLEKDIKANLLKKLEKKANKVQTFDLKENKKERFDVFSLTDAFGRRDKKKLWVLYQEAKQKGVSDEEIHGILFWQIKSMALAESSGSAKEAGLNPFVFKKSKSFLSNYSLEEVQKFSRELIKIYHDARRGICNFNVGMELFFLKSL